MTTLSAGAKDLVDRPIHAWVTTLRPDGSLQGTVVWVTRDGDDVIFNTAVGRVKEQNLRKDPRVGVSLLDPDDPFHYLDVSGTAELYTENADATIDALAKKYMGVDEYPMRQPGEQRINVRVKATNVIYNSPQ